MAVLTWKKNFNDYEINLKFICHYKNDSIVEFDSHDMSDSIDKIFDLINTVDYQKVIKMSYLEFSKYLFNELSNLYSVEFINSKSKSEYFIEDINNN